MSMNAEFGELKERLMEIGDLQAALRVLRWDQQTMMASRGAGVRAEQIATLTRIERTKFTDPAVGRLLEELRPYEESLPFDSDDASLIRVARRDYEKATRVPPELSAERVRTAVQAQEVWIEARRQSDFDHFLPYLEKNVELAHRYIDCFAEMFAGREPYDVLLDDYEPGMKTGEVRIAFDTLKQGLVPLIDSIRIRQDRVDDACLHGHFPEQQQKEFSWSVLEQLGASHEAWRLDPTVHPFASNSGSQDIRLTTRYAEDFLSEALFSTMHEFGHGLYEHQIDPALERTPLRRGASHGLHESQSRTWENLVGRSRSFWRFMYPHLQAAFPEQLGDVAEETFYRAANKVQPSYIRVMADEATYCLHIILRFELEQAMIAGSFPLKELPDAWNARFKEFFGLDVPNDTQGVLQDVHWSAGSLGYFPTYALGNIFACQIWQKVEADIPDLYEQFTRGEFDALRGWLRDHLHRHGRKFTPADTLQRVAGGPIDVAPYMDYLRTKFGEIYELV